MRAGREGTVEHPGRSSRVSVVATTNQLMLNRRRQRDIYGLPLAVVVYRIMARLSISQARLARTIGLSPPMLSQLVSAERVKLADPAVLSRLVVLDRRSVDTPAYPAGDPDKTAALLREVRGLHWAPFRVVDEPQHQQRPAPPTPHPVR
jgi:transcriptional regulator with XRE-family HTH domain